MRPIFLLLVALCTRSICLGQPAIQWQKTLGGSMGEIGSEISETRDGGYFIVGRTTSWDIRDSSNILLPGNLLNHGQLYGQQSEDLYAIKLDRNGKIQWQKLIGGYGNEWGTDGFQTNDGGYIVCGLSGDPNGDAISATHVLDYWILKLDPTGAIQWTKSYGGTAFEAAVSIVQTRDGGYVITGFCYSHDGDVSGANGSDDAWVIKINAIGELQWQKSFGGGDHDYGAKVVELPDETIAVGGGTYSTDGDVFGTHGWNDYWLIKLSKDGDLLWQRCYGGSQRNEISDMIATKDGGFFLIGYSASTDGDVHNHILRFDQWAVKTNSIGDIEWEHSYGGESDDATQQGPKGVPVSDFSKSSVDQTDDGGYIIGGSTRSYSGDVSGNHGNNDCWIIKIDKNGAKEWQKCLGGSEDDYSTSVIQTKDHGYIVLGYSYSSDGDVLTHFGQSGPAGYGRIGGATSPSDIWVVKLAPVSDTHEINGVVSGEIASPNPSSGIVHLNMTAFQSNGETVLVSIFDVVGKLSFTCSLPSSGGIADVNLSSLATGSYLLKIADTKKTIVQKLIIQE